MIKSYDKKTDGCSENNFSNSTKIAFLYNWYLLQDLLIMKKIQLSLEGVFIHQEDLFYTEENISLYNLGPLVSNWL